MRNFVKFIRNIMKNEHFLICALKSDVEVRFADFEANILGIPVFNLGAVVKKAKKCKIIG
jgi:hypothetical protein